VTLPAHHPSMGMAGRKFDAIQNVSFLKF